MAASPGGNSVSSSASSSSGTGQQSTGPVTFGNFTENGGGVTTLELIVIGAVILTLAVAGFFIWKKSR
jgi:hypothetical protein